MSYSVFGIHLPNGDMDIDHWADLFGDGCYTVLHGQASCLKRLRERAPHGVVLVRCYLPNWGAVDPGWWAGECAAIYAGVRPYTRHLTWANEQNLALESGGAVGASDARRATQHDYEVIHDWNLRFLTSFKARAGTVDAILHYPAFASGHSDDQDDDGFVGLDICRPGIDQCPILDRHIYFTPGLAIDDRWRGIGRLDLTTALFPGKPLFVSESGNFAVTDPQSVNQYVSAGYAIQRRPEVVGWTPFIADSPDRGHDANNLSRAPAVLDALGRAPKAMRPDWTPEFYTPVSPAPAPQEPPVPADVALSVTERHSHATPENYETTGFGPSVGVVVHSTDGAASTVASEYVATINWFENPAAAVSAQRVIGGGVFREVNTSVHDREVAYHARDPANHRRHSLELAHPADPHDAWVNVPYEDFQYEAAGELIARWRIADEAAGWSWPLHVLSRAELAANENAPGIAYHRDLPAGIRDGKVDPFGPFDGAKLTAAATRWYQRLTGGPPMADTDATLLDQLYALASQIQALEAKWAAINCPHRAAYVSNEGEAIKEWVNCAKGQR